MASTSAGAHVQQLSRPQKVISSNPATLKGTYNPKSSLSVRRGTSDIVDVGAGGEQFERHISSDTTIYSSPSKEIGTFSCGNRLLHLMFGCPCVTRESDRAVIVTSYEANWLILRVHAVRDAKKTRSLLCGQGRGTNRNYNPASGLLNRILFKDRAYLGFDLDPFLEMTPDFSDWKTHNYNPSNAGHLSAANSFASRQLLKGKPAEKWVPSRMRGVYDNDTLSGTEATTNEHHSCQPHTVKLSEAIY